ncbi:MAG: DUF1580 domain-containing protein [Phycisphaerales bacterium]
MVDLRNEQLIEIKSVPKLLPCRPSGKRVHISAVYRWISRGVRGVRLETIAIGGTRYTSIEAIERFSARLDDPTPWQPSTAVAPPRQRTREQQRASEAAARILGLPQ